MNTAPRAIVLDSRVGGGLTYPADMNTAPGALFLTAEYIAGGLAYPADMNTAPGALFLTTE